MTKIMNRSSGGPCYKCTIRLLDDATHECYFQANQKGRYLLDYICEHLNLIEKDYFGLRYVDKEGQRRWLDPIKSILKQTKGLDPIIFSFRVKFYPPNPFQLKEQLTRYQIYLQLRKDFNRGRLVCNDDDTALMAAYAIQAEVGSCDLENNIETYCNDKLLPMMRYDVKQKLLQTYRTEVNELSVEEAEASYLRKACTFDTYGFDYHPVKDQKNNDLFLGMNYSGILTLQGSHKTNHFKWNEVQKINFEGKMFIIHLVYVEKKQTVGFKCPTIEACRHVWQCAVEQRLFFTSASSKSVPRVVSGGGFFTGKKFKYSGRVEREVLEEMAQLLREEPAFNRVGSLRRKASSVPVTPSTPMVSDLPNNYNTLPRANFENRLSFNIGEIQFNADGSPVLEPVVENSENTFGRRRADDADVESERKNNNISDSDNVDSNTGNFKVSSSETTLFYNHDRMYEHSASEGRLTSNTNHVSNFSTPVFSGNETAPVEEIYVAETLLPPCASTSLAAQIRGLVRSCAPTVALTLIICAILLVIAFETDVELFTLMRRAPEMVFIRRQYYEPAKDRVATLVRQLFKAR